MESLLIHRGPNDLRAINPKEAKPSFTFFANFYLSVFRCVVAVNMIFLIEAEKRAICDSSMHMMNTKSINRAKLFSIKCRVFTNQTSKSHLYSKFK